MAWDGNWMERGTCRWMLPMKMSSEVASPCWKRVHLQHEKQCAPTLWCLEGVVAAVPCSAAPTRQVLVASQSILPRA